MARMIRTLSGLSFAAVGIRHKVQAFQGHYFKAFDQANR